MNLRGSQTNSLLGSFQNASQLSLYSELYSQTSSEGNSSFINADRSREDRNGLAKATASSSSHVHREVSGHGYLMSRRTVPDSKTAQSAKDASAMHLSHARTRRKQERQMSASGTQRSLLRGDSDSGGGGEDLESYLMSFGRSSQVGVRTGKASKDKKLPRGSNLDWAKLIESDHSLDDAQFENVFSDSEGQSTNAFLKKSTRRLDTAADSAVYVRAQTRDSARKRKTISPEIKYLDENSSPNINDLVITDSLRSASSDHAPVATNRLKQVQTRNLQSDSNHSLHLGTYQIGHMKNTASDLNSRPDMKVSHSPGKSKSEKRRNSDTRLSVLDDSVSMSEEPSISESFDFKHNILSSIDQLEADINDIHEHSDTSTFKQNIHDVHSLGELEELSEDERSSYGTKDTKIEASVDHMRKHSTKMATSTKSPNSSPRNRLKTKPSGFKFSASAATTAVESTRRTGNGGHQQKSVSYSSDGFESESVMSEVVESVGGDSDEEVIEEESIVTSHEGAGSESCDEMEETVRSGSEEHTEYSYSSFSETVQKNMSELTESQQMDHSSTESHSSNSPSELSATESTARVQDACVQTDPSVVMVATLPSSQLPPPVGYPTVSVAHHYGKEYLDPSPILPHVISPDALEAVTGYTPSVVALTDMLRTQLSITRSLVARSRQLAATVSDSISANYHYTTLEETKQYIARHKPKLLQFDEASKLLSN